MRVLVQLRPPVDVAQGVVAGEAVAPELADFALSGVSSAFALDTSFPAVTLPAPVTEEPGGDAFSFAIERTFSEAPRDVTHIVRGSIPDGLGRTRAVAELQAHPDVVGVFSDPAIETCVTCGGGAAVGTDADVAKRLDVADLAGRGMDGTGVPIAIVDTGINEPYLTSHGRAQHVEKAGSWKPKGVPTAAGQHPVAHGTMCAYDAGIAAPKAPLLDHAVLLSARRGGSGMAGLLSDAILSYAKLMKVIMAQPAAKRALVVSNSWGMFSPAWDFPVGHPGNYSDNPVHPFNLIVAALEWAGADILFAAGNCGRECPDGRCDFGTTRPICGANSLPSVISVAGVDVKLGRVGYSSEGPGRLDRRKPDLSSYTHFSGSGVFSPHPDSGTSAACPVLAGYVAAIRTKYPVSVLKPSQLRSLLEKTAVDLGTAGFDYRYGWGVPDTEELLARLQANGRANGHESRKRATTTGAGHGRTRRPAAATRK